MSLTFEKKVNWTGSYTSLGNITYKQEVEFNGISGKDPIKDFESGGVLFQGTKKVENTLKLTKMKFMFDNVQEFSGKVTVTGPAVGTVKNCPKVKSLDMSEHVETRILRTKIEDTVSLDTVRGEIIGAEIDGETTLNKSGLILRNILGKKDFTITDSYIEGSHLYLEKDLSLKKSTLRLNTVQADSLKLEDAKLQGNNFKVTKDYSLKDHSVSNIVKMTIQESATLEESKQYGEEVTITKDLTITSSVFDIDKLNSKSITASNSFLLGTDFDVTDDTSLTGTLSNIDTLSTKNLSLDTSRLTGASYTVSDTTSLKDSIGTLDMFATKTLDLDNSQLVGSLYIIEDSLSLKKSVASVKTLSASSAELKEDSSVLGQKLSVSSIEIDDNSSVVGLVHGGKEGTSSSITSSGALLLTSSKSSLAINDHAFFGLNVDGQSNYSYLYRGLDGVSVPRTNFRTSNDFIAQAYLSAYIDAGINVKVSAGVTVYNVAGNDVACLAGNNFVADAGSVAAMHGSQLLCEADSTMNLVAGSTQLLKGSTLYCVGSCHFTPSDNCTAIGCSKPIWLSGGTGKSVSKPGESPPAVPS